MQMSCSVESITYGEQKWFGEVVVQMLRHHLHTEANVSIHELLIDVIQTPEVMKAWGRMG
jgi:hypothetical protein